MDANDISPIRYRKVKPQGKVRKRAQDLRIPSSSCWEFLSSRPTLDLSHNESTRLAADCLLTQGLEEYHEALKTEGEVDFLSELEKNYFLENGKDSNANSDPDAGDGSDDEFESLSTSSHSETQRASVSKDSDPTEAGLSPREDMKGSAESKEPNVKVLFYTENRAAGLKDVVREFIRKAEKSLAIVTDHFSDVELLCDLLEASKKRFVSVHLLLDHLNLNIFSDMWQELKLQGKDFPKFSVHSVQGETYCAKTGRKLTGQISETFIMTDWTEALTGSFSFSWLSWLVHRSLAYLVKGSAVTHFQQELDRLYSCSNPVPGFITLPLMLSLQTSSHATKNEPKGKIRSDQTDMVHIWDWIEDGLNSHTKERMHTDQHIIPQYSRPLRKPVMQHMCMDKFTKPTLGRIPVQDNSKEKRDILQRHQIQRNSHFQNHLVQYTRSQQNSFNHSTTGKTGAEVKGAADLHSALPTHRQWRAVGSSFNKDLEKQDRHNVKLEDYSIQRQNRTTMTHPGIAAGINKLRGERNTSMSKSNHATISKVTQPFLSQGNHEKQGVQSPIHSARGPTYGQQYKILSNGIKTQDQSQRHNFLQPQTTCSPTTSTATNPKLESRLFLKAAGKPSPEQNTSQQVKPSPRLAWMTQANTVRPRPMARQSSFNSAFDTGQKMNRQLGFRQFHSTSAKPLTRSKSMTERPATHIK